MGLKIKRNANGELRRIWYGHISINGRKADHKLDVPPIAGTIPLTAAGAWDREARGDAEFERSRAQAEKAFARLIAKDATRRDEVAKLEGKLAKATGRAVGRVRLTSLLGRWEDDLTTRPDPSDEESTDEKKRRAYRLFERNRDRVRLAFDDFIRFANRWTTAHGVRVVSLEDVTREMAVEFFRDLSATYARATALEKFGKLRVAWESWSTDRQAPNPFLPLTRERQSKDKYKVHRRPLTAEESVRLLDLVREHRPAVYPLVVAVMTTGLRIEDAAGLKWEEVRIERNHSKRSEGVFGVIERENLKTGARVAVPIIHPFEEVLADLESKRDDRDVYLFPRDRERYATESTRTGLFREIKPFLALAVEPGLVERLAQAKRTTDVDKKPLSLDEIMTKIDGARFQPKKADRLRAVMREIHAGFKPSQVAADLGLARAQVSQDLDELEDLTGETYRTATKRRRLLALGVDKKTLLKLTRQARETGKNAASLYGWHSLRASYVVLGIEAGVPLAYIQKAVGHSTVKMTLEYFNPTGEHALAVMSKRMANVFATYRPDSEPIEAEAPAALPAPSVDEMVDKMSEDERKALARRLLGL